jgi:O-antigen/teichoic acid export membrane protein
MIETAQARLQAIYARLFHSELVRRIARNSGYLFTGTGISAAISLVQGILAARLLGVAGFGLLGAITVFVSVVNKLASFRMDELVVRYVGAYTEANDLPRAAAIFKAAALAEMGASIVAFALVWLLAPLGAQYFGKDLATANLFAVYGLIVLANLIAETSTGLLQISDRFRRMAGLNVAASLATLIVIAGAYFFGGGLTTVLLAYVIGKTVGAVGLTVAALREASRRWGPGWHRTPLSLLGYKSRELTHFAVSTNISASLSIINKDSELLWVSLFRSPVEAGYYKLAIALANLVQMPVSPLPSATYPELSRETARKNWPNVRYILRQGSLLAGGYTLASSAFLVILGIPLIRYLYKPEFLPAYPALLILLVGFFFANTFYWQRIALLALGRPDFPTLVNLALAVLKVIGVLLLVPVFGYVASAGLLSASYVLGVSVSVWMVYRILRGKESG